MSIKSRVLDKIRVLFANDIVDGFLSNTIRSNPNSYFWRRVIPGNHLYKKDSIRHSDINGIIFELDVSDYPDWSLYFSSKTDSSRNVLNFISEGDFVLDIGGNIGQTALMLASKVGPAGKVISFEPFPSTLRKFDKNLELNQHITNIKLERVGLSNKEEVLLMQNVCKTNSAANRASSKESLRSEANVDYVEVRSLTLDNYVAKNFDKKSQRIDFIKIDVEGFEMKVLEGAKITLHHYKPKLFIEINDNNLRQQGNSAQELLSFLEDIGYQILDTSSNKTITTVRDLDWHTDIFCFCETT